MTRLLSPLGVLVRLRPGLALGLLAVATLVLGALASQVESEAELTAFAPESEVEQAYQQVETAFGGQDLSVLIIVEADGDGSVVSSHGLDAAAQIREAVATVEPPEMAPEDWALSGEPLPSMTYADALFEALDAETASDEEIAEAASAVVAEDPQAAALLSQDYDPGAAINPGAGMIVVPLDLQASFKGGTDLRTLEFATELSVRVAEAAESLDLPGLSTIAFNELLLNHEMEAGAEDELPMLLGASLALILLILIFTFRSVTDVMIGIGGLIVAVIWTFGLAALLGPGYLDIVGPFSQVATVVPVLIVALGIDYAIHLTSRYREEQRNGRPPRVASYRAVMTVGGALVLATVTVVTGFLTNLVSPLPPLRDFGIFVTVGVLSAFVVFTIGVPAIRHLLDQRGSRPTLVERVQPGSGEPRGFAALMGRTAVLSQRYPLFVFAVALVITLAASVAATRIPTTFAVTDFIPEDSRSAEAIGVLEDRFGGDLTERSYVVIEGDIEDPAVANAILQVEGDLAALEHVQQVNGDVASLSPASLVAQIAAADPDLGAAAEDLGWLGGSFDADADVGGLYDLAADAAPDQAAQVMTPDRSLAVLSVPTVAGQEEVDILADQLRALTGPLDATGVSAVVTSQYLVLDEALDALTATQAQGIVITLVAATVLLVAFYGFGSRRPLLGLVTVLPSILVTAWTLGTMWMLGISFNVLTAMVSALAIGIGVPFGIHVAHRFLEELESGRTVDAAIGQTVTRTGGALAGSAATTAAGFGVLGLSALAPIQQFGMIVALVIIYSLIAATIIEPAILRYWALWRGGYSNGGGPPGDVPAETPESTSSSRV